jgi:hypothetical protein
MPTQEQINTKAIKAHTKQLKNLTKNIGNNDSRLQNQINEINGKNVSNDPPKVAGTYRETVESVGEFFGKVYTYDKPFVGSYETIIEQNEFFTSQNYFFNGIKLRENPNPGVLRKVGGRWELHSVSTIDQGTITSDLVINDENVCNSFSFIRTEPGIVPADPTKTSDYPSVSRGFSYRTISFSNSEKLIKLLNKLPTLPEGQLYAAMGKDETLSGDLLGLTSQEQEARVVKESSDIVGTINSIIGNPDLWINREYNGKGKQKLGIHRLVILTREDEIKLREAGYGLELVRYGDKVFRAFVQASTPMLAQAATSQTYAAMLAKSDDAGAGISGTDDGANTNNFAESELEKAKTEHLMVHPENLMVNLRLDAAQAATAMLARSGDVVGNDE